MKPLFDITNSLFPVMVVLLCGARVASIAEYQKCYCDGWQSTNTASPHMWWSTPTPGKSYRGAKNTTRGGLRCKPLTLDPRYNL